MADFPRARLLRSGRTFGLAFGLVSLTAGWARAAELPARYCRLMEAGCTGSIGAGSHPVHQSVFGSKRSMPTVTLASPVTVTDMPSESYCRMNAGLAYSICASDGQAYKT